MQKTAEVSAVAAHGVTGRLFFFLGRVHRYTARVPPPSGRGRGGGDAGSLLPGVLPPELVASYARARTDSPCRQSFVPPTPPATPPPHHHQHHQEVGDPFSRVLQNFMAEFSCRPRQVDGDGAAKRRRQRRLRSWLRHEQQTVAAVLATVSHHSYPKVDTAHDGLRAQRTVTSTREGVEHETYGGLRAQKPPLPGKRPGLPPEPEPLVRAVTDGYVAAQSPLLVVPSMAGGDTIDGTTLRFLLEHCLRMKTLLEEEERRKEEEKEKEKEKEKAARSSASSAPKRTRKKRRKKKAPRGVRIRRCGQGFCSRSSLSGPSANSTEENV